MDIVHSKNPDVFNKPQITVIGNGYYRRFRTENDKYTQSQTLSPYTDNEEEFTSCVELDDDIEIKVTKGGQFLTQFHVAQYFLPSIVGVKGTRRRELESTTGTYLKIPKHNEVGDIVITGNSERDICSAKTRINMIILKMRDKHPITHFVSIPIVSEQIRNNFDAFKLKLLNGPPLRGIEESIFQSTQKLHLTVATMVLLDDIETENAARVLQECNNEFIEPLLRTADKLSIVLEGIEIMNDDPSTVDVLYGKIKVNPAKYNTVFQRLSDGIIDYFSHKGLIRKQYDSVKLHVTLINSRYRNRSKEGAASNSFQRESFDSSYILDKFKNYYFGEASFNDIHLSVRFTSTKDKYYDSVIVINI